MRIRKPLHVVVDNETRWLSQLYMIRRALMLRPYLETLVLKHKQAWEKDNTLKRSQRPRTSAVMPSISREENKLEGKDWAVLEASGSILQSFEDALKAIEGGDSTQAQAGTFRVLWQCVGCGRGIRILAGRIGEGQSHGPSIS